MRRSTPPPINSNLPQGDWHYKSRRQQQEALKRNMELELLRGIIQLHM